MNLIAEHARCQHAATILRGVLLLQSFGLLGIYYTGRHETESDIYGLLYFDMGYPESVAQRIDDGGVLLAACCGVVVALAGWMRIGRNASAAPSIASAGKGGRFTVWLERFVAFFLVGWFFALALSHQLRGGPYADLALGEHAVRYLAPLALLLCVTSGREKPLGDRRWGTAMWILRIAAAATFAVHGYKAIESHGQFLDLILLSELRWTSWQVSEQTATLLLSVIGWIDLLIAAIILTRWWPAAAIYMMVWGVVTAFSRMTAMGIDYWPSTLVRAANGGVPIALFATYWLYLRQPKKSTRPYLEPGKPTP